MKVLEGKSYRLQHPWVGVVNRSQADINKKVDMIAARHREREFFATSPYYAKLASRMGSEYLAKLLSKVTTITISNFFPFTLPRNNFNTYPKITILVLWYICYCFLFQQLEAVIKSRMPAIMSLIQKSIADLEGELDHLGKPVAVDAGVRNLYLF